MRRHMRGMATALVYADAFAEHGETWFKTARDTGAPDAPCAVCGTAVGDRAVKASDQFGPGFADADALVCPGEDWVCEPCSWALGSKPPRTLRTWSILYREDQAPPETNTKLGVALGPRTWATNKSDMRPILAALIDPPEGEWVVAVAETGQIHTLPFAPVNRSRSHWSVRFERVDVTMQVTDWLRICWHVAELYRAGYGADEIANGEPTIGHLSAAFDEWERHGVALTEYHRSPALSLAAFLQLKRDHRDDNRSAVARACSDARLGLDGLREHEADPPEGVVGSGAVSPADGGDARQPRRVRDDDVAQAPDRQPAERVGQLDLFAGV